MAAWLIRVVAKPRKHIDANLVAQAVIAYARQLWERDKAAKPETDSSAGGQEPSQ